MIYSRNKDSGRRFYITSYEMNDGNSKSTGLLLNLYSSDETVDRATSLGTKIQSKYLYREIIESAAETDDLLWETRKQVQDTWGSRSFLDSVQCLVSIGTGTDPGIVFRGSGFNASQSIKAMVEDPEDPVRIIREEKARLGKLNRYFRFDLRNELSDIQPTDLLVEQDVIAATQDYLSSEEVVEEMSICGDNLSGRQCKFIHLKQLYITVLTLL